MADEPGDAPAAAKPRVRRAAPTIDLKATEIPVEPDRRPADRVPEDITEPQAGAAETPADDTVAAAAAPPSEPSESPRMDSGPQRRRKAPPSAAGQKRAAEGRKAVPGQPPAGPPHGVPTVAPALGYAVTGGALGALAVIALFGTLWWAGIFAPDNSGLNSLDQRLSRVEARTGEIASRPAMATAPDNKAVDALASRIAKLEQAVSAAAQPQTDRSATAEQLAATGQAIKSLQDNVTRLTQRADDNAAATREARGQADAAMHAADAARSTAEQNAQQGNVEALSNRIATLEKTTKALSDRIASRPQSAADRPLRFAVAAQALRVAVERGNGFAAELAAAKQLSPDPQKLKPLEAYAASGVPSSAALTRQLSELTPDMLQRAQPQVGGGFLERLQANAGRLVRISPINEVPGDDDSAIVRRAEAKASRGDIAEAVAELNKLPADVRTPAADWIKQAQARDAALQASRQIEKDALATLGVPSP